jgi:hypothetical protein
MPKLAASRETLPATQAKKAPTPRRYTVTVRDRDGRHTKWRQGERRVECLERQEPSPSYALPEATCERNDINDVTV